MIRQTLLYLAASIVGTVAATCSNAEVGPPSVPQTGTVIGIGQYNTISISNIGSVRLFGIEADAGALRRVLLDREVRCVAAATYTVRGTTRSVALCEFLSSVLNSGYGLDFGQALARAVLAQPGATEICSESLGKWNTCNTD